MKLSRKDILDLMYSHRFRLEEKITELKEKDKQPIAQCCEQMHYESPYKTAIKAYEYSLEKINHLIENFIK